MGLSMPKKTKEPVWKSDIEMWFLRIQPTDPNTKKRVSLSLYGKTKEEVVEKSIIELRKVKTGGYSDQLDSIVDAYNNFIRLQIKPSVATATYRQWVLLGNKLFSYVKKDILLKWDYQRVQAIFNDLGKQYSKDTIAHYYHRLSRFTQYLVDTGVLTNNFMGSIKRTSTQAEKEKSILQEKQFEQLIDYIQKYEVTMDNLTSSVPIIALGISIFTGMRSAEVFGTTWSDLKVDKEGQGYFGISRYWSPAQKPVAGIIEYSPGKFSNHLKNRNAGEYRETLHTIPNWFVDKLYRFQKQQQTFLKSYHLSNQNHLILLRLYNHNSTQTSQPVSAGQVGNRMKKLFKNEFGWKFKNMSFYRMRASYESYWISKIHDPMILFNAMGHSGEMAYKKYIQITNERQRKSEKIQLPY